MVEQKNFGIRVPKSSILGAFTMKAPCVSTLYWPVGLMLQHVTNLPGCVSLWVIPCQIST